MDLSAQTTPQDSRIVQAKAWLVSQQDALQKLGIRLDLDSCRPASSDASFRRYFRLDGQIQEQAGHLILMDAPPDKEDIRPFIAVDQLLTKADVHVPTIWRSDVVQGFLLCSDLGQQTFLNALTALQAAHQDCTPLYQDAWQTLIRLQAFSLSILPRCTTSAVPAHHAASGLKPYDAAKLMQEMRLFDQWFLGKHKPIGLTESEQAELLRVYERILESCLSQPAVIVHRDYHSRNLMVMSDRNPGVLDFQDAVFGPITYDLASLLRDAYIEWPEETQIDWAVRYWQDARAANLPVQADFGEFWRDFEWMGLQRHIKVLGIFARLYYRDGKENYLRDLPVVMRYAMSVARRYQGLGPLAKILERCA